MVYVRLDVVDYDLSLREQAAAALEEASWSPEQWHQSHRGMIALKRAVKEVRRQGGVGTGASPNTTPVRLTRSRPSALASPSAESAAGSSGGAGAALAPRHLEVRRCTRHLRDALRDMGRPGPADPAISAGANQDELEHQLVRATAALATAPNERTHTHIDTILDLVRSTGFQIKSHAQMQKLCRIAKHLVMSQGAVVCRQGDVDYDIYIVLLGSLSVMIDGKEVEVMGVGKFFGELMLLDGADSRNATVICKGGAASGQTHLLRLRADDLNASLVDLELIFGHAKAEYHGNKLAGLKRLELKLSAAMAHDPPPFEAYASHRDFVAREDVIAYSIAFAEFQGQLAKDSTAAPMPVSAPASKLRMDLLRQVELFKSLSDHDLLQLCKALVPVRFEKGDILMKQGDRQCDRMLVISEGEASVSKKGQGLVHIKRVGEAVGETALLTDDPRNATVLAITPIVRCFELRREDFDKHVFGKIKYEMQEGSAKLRRFESVTKVESVIASGKGTSSDGGSPRVGSGTAPGQQISWEDQHLEDRLLRWTTPLITRAAARARLREFDGALLDVRETLRIQPRHKSALAMQPKLLAHALQHRERVAADREVVSRSLYVASMPDSRAATRQIEPEIAARSELDGRTLERSERSLALYAKLKQEANEKRLVEEEKARKQLEAAAEAAAAKKPSGRKPVAVAASAKKKTKTAKKKGTARRVGNERAEKTKSIVLTSLDASRSAAARRELRAARRYALGQFSSPDLRWQAPHRDGPPLSGLGGVSKRCVKVAPAAVALEAELGRQSSATRPYLVEEFRSSRDNVARDRPYAQFWRSVKFSSAVFSPWTALDELHGSSSLPTLEPNLGTAAGGKPGEPSPSHWDYVLGRVGDTLVDELDARATRRRLLRMIEMLTHVFAYYTRLSPDAAEPRPGPRLLETWSDGRRVKISPAVIHPSRLVNTEPLGCLWYDTKPPTAASGLSIRTSWSQASLAEMNSTLAERSASSAPSAVHKSPSGTLGWESDDADAEEYTCKSSAAADAIDCSSSGESDESSGEENDSASAEDDHEADTPLAGAGAPLYELRPTKHLDLFARHPWPPNGSKPMLVAQARRVIAKLYEEKVQADGVDDRGGTMRQSFPSFICEYFDTKYGLKTIAQNKLGELINSIRKFASGDDLLKVFGSLSGMLDSSSYSACACDFVLDCIGSVYHNHEAIDEMLSDVNKQGEPY
jgi:CRP-like cAMP-binding protein